MRQLPALQPVQLCVLGSDPEVNKSKRVGVRTVLHQMANFHPFYSELADSLIHLEVEEKSQTALMQDPMWVPGVAVSPAPWR